MRIRRKYLFYALAFTSAIIAAAVSAIDAKIINDVIIDDPWAFGVSCFVVGIFVSFIIVLVFSIPVNGKSIGSKIIDPSFKRLRFVRKEELKYHALAGLGNAFLTIGYFSLLFITLSNLIP